MKKYNNMNKHKNSIKKHLLLGLITVITTSCSDLEQDFSEERYLTDSHFKKVISSGGVGIESIDEAILSYLRDGESGTDEFGLKAVDQGFDLRSNDMDMSVDVWFGTYNNFNNVLVNGDNNQFLWSFFYRVINNSNEIMSRIPDGSPDDAIIFRNKAHFL